MKSLQAEEGREMLACYEAAAQRGNSEAQRKLDEDLQSCVRAFRLTQLTCRKGEDIFQKLSTAYHAAMSLGCSLFVMVDVEGVNQPAEIYFGYTQPGSGRASQTAQYILQRPAGRAAQQFSGLG